MSYLTARGWLTEKERRFLFKTAEGITTPSPTFLNIGVEYGASVVCMMEGNPDAFIYAVDIDTSKYEDRWGGRLHLEKNDSIQYLQSTPESDRFDFAFVDGDHSYEGALGDAIESGKRIKHGGILAFHDCYSWDIPKGTHAICPEVNQAIEFWFRDYSFRFEELPYVDSIRVFRRKE